ncbi:MAG TPA: chemotaxis protein CheD [bacterium]|nr:chemotaxis protein CheD [bacterium]
MTVVGIGEWKASALAEEQIITHALGSCLGITAYDFTAKVGGMVHVMLPQPGADAAEDLAHRPGKYVGPGLEALLQDCLRLGAQKSRLVLTASGGASQRADEENDFFQIGRRNVMMLRKVLWASGLLLKAQDVGGVQPRTLTLDIATGEVQVKINGAPKRLV